VTTTLKNAILQNRVAHAYLFSGPRGVGKTTTARIFAKALNCQKSDKPTATPCNKCESCLEITEGRSLDVIEIDGASNRGIDEIRQLRENVKFAPSKTRYKVYIIDEVHQITPDGFNALLKTLEEPPAYVKFIFATTHRHKVIPTILSRCQRFDFKRVSISQLVEKLKDIAATEKLDIDEEAFFVVARAADGSVRDAESILDQLVSFSRQRIKTADVVSLLGSIDQEILFEITQLIIEKNASGILQIVNKFVNDGKDPLQFVNGLLEHFRNLAIAKIQTQPVGLIDLPKEVIDSILKQSRSFELSQILYMFNVLNNAQDSMRRSGFARIQLEMILIRLVNSDLQKEPAPGLPKEKDVVRQKNLPGSLDAQAKQALPSNKPTESPSGSAAISFKDSDINYIIQSIQADTATMVTQAQEQPVSDKNVNIAVQERFSVEKEPKEAPGGKMVSINEVRNTWPLVLNGIKTEKISAALFLLEGSPSHMEGQSLIVNFPAQFVFYKEALERAENVAIIEKYLKEALGKNIKIKFVISDTMRPVMNKEAFNVNVKEEPHAHASAASDALAKPLHEKNLSTSEILEEPAVKSAINIFKGRIIRKQ